MNRKKRIYIIGACILLIGVVLVLFNLHAIKKGFRHFFKNNDWTINLPNPSGEGNNGSNTPIGGSGEITTQNGTPTPPPSNTNVSMTPGALNVKDYGAKGDNRTDDTAAFEKAMQAAATGTKVYKSGPDGSAQGVVYVPAGEYRIKNVEMVSNVRLEIDAGAVLMQYAPTRDDSTGYTLFDFGKRTSTTPISNVSFVGVGESSMYGSKQKPTPEKGWDISHSFTIISDPVTTNASQNLKPFSIRYVNGILFENMFAIGNNSDPSNKIPGGTNSKQRFISTGVNAEAPGSDTHYYGPSNMTIRNMYAIGGQGGGGGTLQFQAVRGLTLENIYGEGGITARFETDVSGVDTLRSHGCDKKNAGGGGSGCTCTETNQCTQIYISEVRDVTLNNVWCKNGQAAVSLVPHNQTNTNFTLTNIVSDNCAVGLYTGSTGDPRLAPGVSKNVVVNSLKAFGSNYLSSGLKAQFPGGGLGPDAWTLGKAGAPICVKDLSVVQPITVKSCTIAGGEFSATPGCASSISAMCK